MVTSEWYKTIGGIIMVKQCTIEDHLRNYQAYKTGILNLKKKLDYLHLPYITSTCGKEVSKGTFTPYSTTENAVLDRIESPEAQKINETIKLYEMFVDSIDHALSEVSSDEQQFIKMRYFQKFTIMRISIEIGYSVRQIHRIRHKVLERLSISLGHLNKNEHPFQILIQHHS